MKKMTPVCTVALVLLLAMTALLGPRSADALPAAGKPAPDFVLKSDSGRNIRLSELKGEVVLVNFWASWCAPCRQELPLLNRMYNQYRGAGFKLLAVNVDEDRKNAEAMLRRLELKFPTLFDGSKNVARLYQVDTMPTTVLIDRDGRVRYTHRGYYDGSEKKYEQQLRELLKE
jgi:peroxiredoxin